MASYTASKLAEMAALLRTGRRPDPAVVDVAARQGADGDVVALTAPSGPTGQELADAAEVGRIVRTYGLDGEPAAPDDHEDDNSPEAAHVRRIVREQGIR